MMYDDLVKRLRYCSEEQNGCGMCALSSDCVLRVGLLTQAADAIEKLNKEVMALRSDYWDVTCDPEYRESHFEKDEWGE